MKFMLTSSLPNYAGCKIDLSRNNAILPTYSSIEQTLQVLSTKIQLLTKHQRATAHFDRIHLFCDQSIALAVTRRG